jgi:hypothetical protein
MKRTGARDVILRTGGVTGFARSPPAIRSGEDSIIPVQSTPADGSGSWISRYQRRYHMSMIGNLEAIREQGIRNFVRTACKACGRTIDVHPVGWSGRMGLIMVPQVLASEGFPGVAVWADQDFLVPVTASHSPIDFISLQCPGREHIG